MILTIKASKVLLVPPMSRSRRPGLQQLHNRLTQPDRRPFPRSSFPRCIFVSSTSTGGGVLVIWGKVDFESAAAQLSVVQVPLGCKSCLCVKVLNKPETPWLSGLLVEGQTYCLRNTGIATVTVSCVVLPFSQVPRPTLFLEQQYRYFHGKKECNVPEVLVYVVE